MQICRTGCTRQNFKYIFKAVEFYIALISQVIKSLYVRAQVKPFKLSGTGVRRSQLE
jgi:hypothetical protein